MPESNALLDFIRLHERALELAAHGPSRHPQRLLLSQTGEVDARAFRHLARAVRIASYLGDADATAGEVASRIASDIREGRVLDFRREAEWIEAITWAIGDVEAAPSTTIWPREKAVSQAVRRLRSQGYDLRVDADGIQVSDHTRENICRRVDSIAQVIGGQNILAQTFRILRETERFHDGHWLFGNFTDQVPKLREPTLPFGWLIALGIRHLKASKHPNNPSKAWKNLTSLATDLAACVDAERYSAFEGIDIRPVEIPIVFSEAIRWNQLFAHPQSASNIVSAMRAALRILASPDDLTALGNDFWHFVDELNRVVGMCAPNRPTTLNSAQAGAALPILALDAQSRPAAVNRKFLDPLDARSIDHQQQVVFSQDNDTFVLLPRSLTAAAAATMIVHRVWNCLAPNRAGKLAGDLFETVIGLACKQKPGAVASDVSYEYAGKTLQMDVVVNDSDGLITLFEVKSKSLTNEARAGSIIKTLSDYGNSYLALALQLARHERAVHAGATPVATLPDASTADITSIAVSPLSFGPISDRMLARPLLSALAVAEITPAQAEPEATKLLRKFGNAVRGLIEEVRPIATNALGQLDFQQLLIHFYWLDLGEILYLLGRAKSVNSAFRPIRHLTFTTRDFWSEVAFADRIGRTANDWLPPQASPV